MENAQHQVDWFKNLVLTDLAIEKNTSTASSTSSSSIPIKVKKQQKPKSVNVSDNSHQRKPLRSSTAQQQPPSARLATTTAARKPAVSTSNRSKIPNANVKAKPVPVSRHAFFFGLISAPKFHFNKYRLVLHQQPQQLK